VSGLLNMASIHAADNFCNFLLDVCIAHCFNAVCLVLGDGYKEDIGCVILGSESIEVLPSASKW
jgi:hypothetical protein